MPNSSSLSKAQASKLALLSQGLYKEHRLGRSSRATLKVLEQLGYIQVDTISVVERAHHHTLWNRTLNYAPQHLSELQAKGEVFEYWSHAAAYLPMRDYRYSLPRKQAIRDGETHWTATDEKLCAQVLERVANEGPLQSRDFENTRRGRGEWWDWKPAKRALEHLFMRGDLMIRERQNFQKVYDLPERVLPASVDTSLPTRDEYLRHLLLRFLKAHGLGTPAQAGHLRKGLKPDLNKAALELCEEGEVVQLRVAGTEYFARADFAEVLAQPLSRQRIKILSPFDNLLIQRPRTLALFDFDYQIECYVPAAKRRFGYFVLPILWGHRFAGRMDAKVDRKARHLYVRKLFVECHDKAGFLAALHKELDRFCEFNQADRWSIEQIVDHA